MWLVFYMKAFIINIYVYVYIVYISIMKQKQSKVIHSQEYICIMRIMIDRNAVIN